MKSYKKNPAFFFKSRKESSVKKLSRRIPLKKTHPRDGAYIKNKALAVCPTLVSPLAPSPWGDGH